MTEGEAGPTRPSSLAALGVEETPRWMWAAALLCLGALTSLSQAPASIWLLALIGPAAAIAIGVHAQTPARAAAVGWLFGVGYFFPGLLWIGEAFFVEAEKFAWLQPFAVTLLPAGLSLFWAGAFAASALLAARLPGDARPSPATALRLAALWALAEMLRSVVLTGFPWGLFAYAWIETPVAQTAAWIGPHGVNAATLAAAGLLAIAALRLWGREARAAAPSGLAALALVVALFGAGALRLPDAPPPRGDAMLRLVQPNVPQTEKWVPEFRRRNYERLLRLTGAHAPDPLAYVVWPETATPFLIDLADEARAEIMATVPGHARLVLGSQRGERPAGAAAEDWSSARFFNSLFVIAPDATVEAVYDKNRLVPFGEFLPFERTLQSIGVFQLAGRTSSFTAGPGAITLRPEGAPAFTPLICYEAIFPDFRAPLSDRPEILLQVTNDAWFGDSGGPWQHLVQARFRAIEQGLPLARSANTGITASIDPFGRIERMILLGEIGAIDVRPAAPLPPTLYVRIGDGPALAALLLLALAAHGAAWGQAGRLAQPRA